MQRPGQYTEIHVKGALLCSCLQQRGYGDATDAPAAVPTEIGPSWLLTRVQYCGELDCPVRDTGQRSKVLDWLLGYAVHLEYEDSGGCLGWVLLACLAGAWHGRGGERPRGVVDGGGGVPQEEGGDHQAEVQVLGGGANALCRAAMSGALPAVWC